MEWEGLRDDSIFVFPVQFRTQDLRTLISIVFRLRSDQLRAIISDLRSHVPPISNTMAQSRMVNSEMVP
jgi:hypothetical protein